MRGWSGWRRGRRRHRVLCALSSMGSGAGPEWAHAPLPFPLTPPFLGTALAPVDPSNLENTSSWDGFSWDRRTC